MISKVQIRSSTPTHESGLTCIHATEGLCEPCSAEYDEDPSAYWEFGQHPDGIRRWEAFQADLATEAAAERAAEAAQDATPPDAWNDIPW